MILVIINRIIKWGYFILHIKEILIEDIIRIYVKKNL